MSAFSIYDKSGVGLTRKIRSDIDGVSKVQTENGPLVFTGCPTTLAFRKFFLEIVACRKGTGNTTNPSLEDGQSCISFDRDILY
jgi:hypothetical protein